MNVIMSHQLYLALSKVHFKSTHNYLVSRSPSRPLSSNLLLKINTVNAGRMFSSSKRLTIRDLGYSPGFLPPGPSNTILDVPGVYVSQITVPTVSNLSSGCIATKGITIISPRKPDEYYKPCLAGSFCFNGNGELTGTRQIEDWGFINTPIAFTNSFSLGTVIDGMWDWILDQQDRLGWDELTKARHYGTPVVGETCDWMVNSDVRKSRLEKADISRAFAGLRCREDGGSVTEGHSGGGAGMTCHMFAGGTGTASRVIGGDANGGSSYTLAVLCQSNYGVLSELFIGSVPIGKILQKEAEDQEDIRKASEGIGGRTKDGSILILIITDAPLATHQLNRVARHATAGLAAVGSNGIGRTFSGDIFLAVSTAEQGPEQLENFARGQRTRPVETYTTNVVKNESIDAFFVACAEATEEAILNSMVGGREGTVAMDGTKIPGLPTERIKQILDQYLVKV